MLHRLWLAVISGAAFLLSTGIGNAQTSQATLSIGAEVSQSGCTATSRVHGGNGSGVDVRCSLGASAYSAAKVLRQFGGVAGPDDVEGTRVTVAY